MKIPGSHTIPSLLLMMFFASAATLGGSGGSGYSRYGIGDLRYFGTDRSMGMGGASIAVLSSNTIDRMNPASWVKISRTRFSIGALYEGFSTSDNNQSVLLSGMSFNGFMIAIPIATESGVVFAIGITPYSRVNYNVLTPASQAGFNYEVRYLGDGGLSLGQTGISASITDELHVGAKLNYYFGTLNYSTKQTFSGSQYTNAEVIRSTTLKGIGGTFGVVYGGLKDVFHLPATSALNVGLVASTSSDLTAEEERFFTFNTSVTVTAHDTSASPEGTVHLPFSLGGGISFLSDRWLFAADLYYQNWYNYRINNTAAPELRNSYRFGAGGEFLPKRDASAPFTQQIAYRLGFFYNASYYRLKGEPINEIGVTGGLGIPIVSDTRLNIGVEYSFRGTTDLQLQKDKILRISLTLSGGELWFVRPSTE